MVELGLVPFTPSKQHEVACLENVYFDPKRKSILWRTEKTLKMGFQPDITTLTEKTVVKDVEEYPKQMAFLGIATAHANAHDISKLTETLDRYKGKMAEMKEVLRKEERVGRESKRKYEATLSDYEKLQQDYQILGEERDTLKLLNMTLDREKHNLERKMEEVEAQKSTVDQQEEQYKALITELEAQNSSLELLLKAYNEQKMDITPLRKHALLIRGKMYHVLVKLVE